MAHALNKSVVAEGAETQAQSISAQAELRAGAGLFLQPPLARAGARRVREAAGGGDAFRLGLGEGGARRARVQGTRDRNYCTTHRLIRSKNPYAFDDLAEELLGFLAGLLGGEARSPLTLDHGQGTDPGPRV